jgi:hypothetical protein
MSGRNRTVRLVCKNPDEAANIQRALDEPEVRAFLGIVGVMLPLSQRGRTRVLQFVSDKLNEEAGSVRLETTNGQHQLEASRTVRT